MWGGKNEKWKKCGRPKWPSPVTFLYPYLMDRVTKQGTEIILPVGPKNPLLHIHPYSAFSKPYENTPILNIIYLNIKDQNVWIFYVDYSKLLEKFWRLILFSTFFNQSRCFYCKTNKIIHAWMNSSSNECFTKKTMFL